MAKVILDAGHGGSDTGEVIGNRMEKNENLLLTLAVGEILVKNGIEVVYTRTSDDFITVDNKITIVNNEKGDLFVSLHRISTIMKNSNPGVESIIQEANDFARTAAQNINKQLEEIGYTDLGIIQADIDFLRFGSIPTVLVLIGYFRSALNVMQFEVKFNETANAIAQGILDSFEIVSNNNNPQVYRYRVQVGLFRNYNNAFNLQNELIMEQYPAEIIQQGDFFAVQVGDFADLDEAATLEQVLRIRGYNTLLVAV